MPYNRFLTAHGLIALALALAFGLQPAVGEASQDSDPRSVTLILDFPLAFVEDLSAVSIAKAGQHEHGEDKKKPGGHGHAATDAGSLTIVHKTFQDRLLVLEGGRATTTEGLSHAMDAGNIQGMSAAVLAYYRRGDAVRDDAMAITFTTEWKLAGAVSGGKETVLYEGVIKGGVRDHLSGTKPSPEIARVKNEITPPTLPTFSLSAVEKRLGIGETGTYRLTMHTSTDMTAMVKNRGKGGGRGEMESFNMEVVVKGGKRERITIEFPYTTVTASVKR